MVNNQAVFFRVKLYLDQTDALQSSTSSQLSENVPEQFRTYNHHKALILPKTDTKSKKKPFPVIKDMKIDSEEVHVDLGAATRVKRPMGRPKLIRKSYDKVSTEDEDSMLHIPHTEYWMFHIPINTDNDFTREAWQLPQSFMQLLEECGSLIEMQPAALYREVMYLEVLHKDLSSCFSANPKNVSQELFAGYENRCQHFKQRW